jgi:hypothetical protein
VEPSVEVVAEAVRDDAAAYAEGESMSWSGIRVTVGCGHMRLEDKPKPGSEAAQGRVIGALTACLICPVRVRRGGGRVSAVRQIVNVEPVTAPRRPERIDSIHDYWEGEGH